MEKNIAPRDIFFIVSEAQNDAQECDPCFNFKSEEVEEGLNFGFQRYTSFEIPPPKPVDNLIHYPAVDAITCELKVYFTLMLLEETLSNTSFSTQQMKMECQQALDYVFKLPDREQKLTKPPCRDPDTLEKVCRSTCNFARVEGSQPAIPEYYKSLPVPPKPKRTICKHDFKPEDQPYTKPIRFCPICLFDMSWLPKFASCPNCGAKPILEKIEKKVRQPTADEIILEYLGKSKQSDDLCEDPCKNTKEKKIDDETSDCKCTCKGYKLCAHCRVRQMVNAMNLYRETAEQDTVREPVKFKKNTSEDCCVAFENPQISRPFLARVFSELRDMYDIKETIRPSKNDFNSAEKAPMTAPIKPVLKGPYGKHTEGNPRTIKGPHRVISKHHKYCASRQRHVSRCHGWAWDLTCEARKYGWRPGAVLRPAKKTMEFFLNRSNTTDEICKTTEKKIAECDMPTLSLCKKNGEIFITLRPINNTHVQQKPIVFRVVKSKLAVALKQIKRALKDQGFPKCTCHQTLMKCVCRDGMEKRILVRALQEECKRRGMENCVDQLILTDTSESDYEYDFDVNSPAAMAKPCLAVQPRTINHSTQTVLEDQKASPRYPEKLSPYYRAYDCAVGDRYATTAIGAIGESPFEEGLFGYRGGGLHGESIRRGGRPKMPVIWGEAQGGPIPGGGRVVPRGPPGGKTFPGPKKEPRKPSKPIPVRMLDRFYKAAEAKAKAEELARQNAAKAKVPNMIDYITAQGLVRAAWDPNRNA